MRVRSSLLILLPCVLALYSCTFEPSGSFVKEVPPPDASSVGVVLSDQSNPIPVYWPTTFTFQAAPQNAGPYAAIVKLAGLQIFSGESQNGFFTFVLNPSTYQNGTLPLDITVACMSNSGSLAAQLDAEVLTFTKSFSVLIDNSKPTQVEAPTVAIEDGKLMVRWIAPTNQNFKNLVLVRETTFNFTSKVDTLKPASKTETSYHDHSYVGGQVQYSVHLRAPGFHSKGKAKSFDCVPVTISVNEDITRVSWETILYGNDLTLKYQGFQSFPNTAGGVDISLRFGEPSISAYINVEANHPAGFDPFLYQVRKEISKGIKTRSFNSVKYSPAINSYLLVTAEGSYRVQVPGYETFSTASTTGFVMMSANGANIYSWNGNFLSNGLGLHKMDTGFGIIESYDLKTILSGAPGLSAPAAITDDNFLAGNFYGTVKPWNILNMTNKTVAWEGTSAVVISPNGNYLINNNSVYVRSGGNWNTQLGTLGESFGRIDFANPSGTNRLLGTTSTGELVIIDLDVSPGSGALPTISHSLPVPGIAGYKYDAFTNKLYRGTSDAVYIYDANTFQQVAVHENISQGTHVVFVNGVLFHHNGYILPPDQQ